MHDVQWQQSPRPVLGRIVQTLAISVRLWALPFAVLAWVVGVIVQAVALGFGVAWEMLAMEWARDLCHGKRASGSKRAPMLADESEDDDEWDD